MIKKLMKTKVETGDWPDGIDTEEAREEFIMEWEQKFGVEIDRTQVAFNPGKKSVVKLCLVSLWGKLG